MSVYRKFDKNDILFSTIHTRPKVSVKYGANGWEGSTGVSASLSLYGGVRSRRDVKSSDFDQSGISIYPLDPVDTHSIDKVIFVSGSYPSTGSIRFVRCRDQVAPTPASITGEQWYEEHFRPLDLLYDFYGTHDSNYFRGNHDFYSAMLLADVDEVGNPYPSGSYFIFSGTFAGAATLSPTSSWTAEAWIKPLPIGTSSAFPFPHYPTYLGQHGIWNLFLDTDGAPWMGLELAADPGSKSSVNCVPGEWNHTAMVVENGTHVTYWVNGKFGGKHPITGSMNSVNAVTLAPSSQIPLFVGSYIPGDNSSNNVDALHGFIFETRIWKKALSGSIIQAIASGTLVNSSSVDLIHYARFNDGPYSVAHGFASGSGAFDYSPGAHHGYMVPHSLAHTNHWQPNDHPTFIPTLRKINAGNKDLRVVHVPSMFYGRQIDPGSVRITDGIYNKYHVVRTFNDDGRGTLYVSGSMTRDISGEEYTGERRRKVGNVFYTEGLIVFTDPALHDMFYDTQFFWQPQVSVSGVFGDVISIDFKGQGRINTKTFNCRLPTAQGNASNNPTWSEMDTNGTPEDTSDDRLVVSRDDGTTYITAVGLYNEDRQLVAVAKFAQPIRKREKDKENLRLKIDF